MNTSLIKVNEPFFASPACAEENNGSPPSCTPGMSRMSGDGKEKGSEKEKKKIHLVPCISHKKLNRL